MIDIGLNLMGKPYEEVARITDENTRRFFGI